MAGQHEKNRVEKKRLAHQSFFNRELMVQDLILFQIHNKADVSFCRQCFGSGMLLPKYL